MKISLYINPLFYILHFSSYIILIVTLFKVITIALPINLKLIRKAKKSYIGNKNNLVAIQLPVKRKV